MPRKKISAVVPIIPQPEFDNTKPFLTITLEDAMAILRTAGYPSLEKWTVARINSRLNCLICYERMGTSDGVEMILNANRERVKVVIRN